MAQPLARPAFTLQDLQTIYYALGSHPLSERIAHHIAALEAKTNSAPPLPTTNPPQLPITLDDITAFFDNQAQG